MNTSVQKNEISKTLIDQQIIFSGNREDLFIGTIVQETDKAIKVDYCFESVWSNCAIIIYSNTIWIPKSVLTNNELGCLTVKKWFSSKFDASKSYKIKKYFQKEGKKIYV